MLNEKIRELIEKRFQQPLKYSEQCEALAQAIFEETGQMLSKSTLKRKFGFVGQPVVPRMSSLDILAQYIGYRDYKMLANDMGEDSQISDFVAVDGLVSIELEEGSQIQITYDPNRVIVMTYLGDNRYIVNEAHGSKLEKGDTLSIVRLAKGFELLADDVVREGKNLGSYHSAKQGGLTSIELI